MNLNKIKRRRTTIEQRISNRDRNIVERWKFINKVYDDLKMGLLVILVCLIFYFLIHHFIVVEYGSVENWWNSGRQTETMKNH